jgi:hypothetical protein
VGRGHASLLSNSDPALIAVRPQAKKGASVCVPNSAAEQTAPPTSSIFGSWLKTPRSVLAPAHHSGVGRARVTGVSTARLASAAVRTESPLDMGEAAKVAGEVRRLLQVRGLTFRPARRPGRRVD